jgi:hypothetical protein
MFVPQTLFKVIVSCRSELRESALGDSLSRHLDDKVLDDKMFHPGTANI